MPCKAGTQPLKAESLFEWKKKLAEHWRCVDEHHLEKECRFRNFQQALDFTNAVGKIAEEQGHHPEITLTWGYVKLRIWTHKIDGLSESDFILAAKIDELKQPF